MEDIIKNSEKELMRLHYDQPMYASALYQEQLSTVKKRLGSKCSYLSYTRHEKKYGVKAVINGTKIDVELGGAPYDVTTKGYNDLFEQLDNYGKDN